MEFLGVDHGSSCKQFSFKSFFKTKESPRPSLINRSLINFEISSFFDVLQSISINICFPVVDNCSIEESPLVSGSSKVLVNSSNVSVSTSKYLLKSSSIEEKASQSLNISSAMTTVKGSAKVTISGGLIKLN